MVLKAFRSGVSRVLAAKRLVLVFYLASLVLGLAAFLPFQSFLNEVAGQSLLGADLVNGVDFHLVLEVLTHHDDALPAVLFLPAFLVAVVYWLVILFLSGGAMAVLVAGRGYEPGLFWGRGAVFFGRFLRLFLWSLLLLLALMVAPVLMGVYKKVAYGDDPTEVFSYWWRFTQLGVVVIALFVYQVVMDYARLLVVTEDLRRTRSALWRALAFVRRHLVRTLGLALLVVLAGAVALLLYRPVASFVDGPSGVAIAAVFVLEQLYVGWRMTLRLVRYGGALALYRSLS